MRRKYIVLCMYFLTCICIVSVGFSSWTIVQNANIKAFGSFASSSVTSHDDCIWFDQNNPIEGFKYCNYGFIEERDGVTYQSNEGTCKINLKINFNACANKFEQAENLKVTLVFQYANSPSYNIFTSTNTINANVILNESSTNKSFEVETEERNTNSQYFKIEFDVEDYAQYVTNNNNEDLAIYISFIIPESERVNAFKNMGDVEFKCNIQIEGY